MKAKCLAICSSSIIIIRLHSIEALRCFLKTLMEAQAFANVWRRQKLKEYCTTAKEVVMQVAHYRQPVIMAAYIMQMSEN